MHKKDHAEPTQATLNEYIDQKFFVCETRLREHLTSLITPYVKQCKDNVTSNRILTEEHLRMQRAMEQVDTHSKLIQLITKRQEDLAKSIEAVTVSVSEVFDKANVLVSKQKTRIDSINGEMGQIRQEVGKSQEDLKVLMGSLGKQYEDMLQFKDQTTELITNFKFEILFDQQKLLQSLEDLRSAKNYTNYQFDKTQDIIAKFDLKLEEYRQQMTFKMQNFDPLQFNLVERDIFEKEKTNIQSMIRQRCREIETKLRHVENVLGFLDAMSEID